MNLNKLLYTLPALILGGNLAQAQTCTQAPSCAELGYTKSATDCNGKSMIKCPFDQNKVFCEDSIILSCDSLGFTDTISTCKGEYTKCPTDNTKGKCINGPQIGDIKYSLKSSSHNGWLLCDGSQYSQSTYSKLYSVIYTNFCSVRNGGCSSGNFAVPDYRGFFLQGYGAPSLSSSYSSYYGSWNYSTSTPQKQGLPNIYGGFGISTNTQDNSLFQRNSSYQECMRAGSCTNTGLTFNAQAYNGIYGSQSSVIPGNYGTYIFIYAGQ